MSGFLPKKVKLLQIIMKNKKNWLILLILPLVAGCLVLQSNRSRNQEPISPAPPEATGTLTPEILTETPTLTSTYEGCAYMWAYQDLPDLSAKLGTSISAINKDASASAYAFGEDCIYADGHKTFGAMETDFNISLKAADLKDEESLGNWIKDVMPVILQIPREEISGPQARFVEFRFVKSDTEQIIVRVPLQNYQSTTNGLSGVELFRRFYIPPINPT
jgi:hypothetical protein